MGAIEKSGGCGEVGASLRGLFANSWFCFALLGFALVFALVDVPSIMILKGAPLSTQPIVASAGRLISAVLLFWAYRRGAEGGASPWRPGGGFFLLAGRMWRLVLVALVLSVGMFLSLSGALFEHPLLSDPWVIFLGSLLLGCGNTLLLVAWCEWLLRLDERVAVQVVALAFVVAGVVEFLVAALYIQLAVVLFVALPFVSVLLLRASCDYCAMSGDENVESVENAASDLRDLFGKWGRGLLLIFVLAVINGSMVTPSIVPYGDAAEEIAAQGCAGLGIALAGGAAMMLLKMSRGAEALGRAGMLLIPLCMLVLYVLALLFSEWALVAILPMYAAKKLLFLLAFVGAVENRGSTARVLYLVAYMGIVAFATIAFRASEIALAPFCPWWVTFVQVAMFIATLALFVGIYLRGRFDGSAGMHEGEEGTDGGEAMGEALAACGLTAREIEIALLLSEGLSSQSIADRLFLSAATVRTHASHIYAKVGVASQSELIVFLMSR